MKTEQGLGTVRTLRDRDGEVIGYQAYLPRKLSKTPPRCKNPKAYKQPIGGKLATEAEARTLLNAAIAELREGRTLRHGLPFKHYVELEIKARLHDARRKYETDARASHCVATWRSIDRRWLQRAEFYDALPAVVDHSELQRYIDWLRDEAEGVSSEPLSGSFIANVGRMIRSVFARVPGLASNPALGLKLPKKGDPEVPFLDLASQRRLFGADEEKVELADRVMTGCGMGAALRIGELLSFEAPDVRTEDADPHLLVRFGGPDHAPTKGGRLRRVELFEPGLGFWRRWMRDHYRGGRLVFAGPQGGYQKHWPEQFPGWASIAGVERLSSHIMRHSYAVAMLSGSWGYSPKSLEFIQQQLGHSERTTTERYYKAFELGTWQREVRQMTGRIVEIREPITADELLGLVGDAGAAGGAEGATMARVSSRNGSIGARAPSLTQLPKKIEADGLGGASTHQSLRDLAQALLKAVDSRDPYVVARAVELADQVLRATDKVEAEVDDREAAG